MQQATLDNVRFWLDRGVDGFRLDAINFCFHDAQLRDNPAKPADKRVGRGFSPDNPYAYQYHYYNNTQPENLPFLERLRALLDEYPGRSAWARSPRRIHWRPRPSTPAMAACTWATASSCWWTTTAPLTSAIRSRAWKRQ